VTTRRMLEIVDATRSGTSRARKYEEAENECKLGVGGERESFG